MGKRLKQNGVPALTAVAAHVSVGEGAPRREGPAQGGGEAERSAGPGSERVVLAARLGPVRPPFRLCGCTTCWAAFRLSPRSGERWERSPGPG